MRYQETRAVFVIGFFFLLFRLEKRGFDFSKPEAREWEESKVPLRIGPVWIHSPLLEISLLLFLEHS